MILNLRKKLLDFSLKKVELKIKKLKLEIENLEKEKKNIIEETFYNENQLNLLNEEIKITIYKMLNLWKG